MLMKGSKIPRIELNTDHLYQHYSLFMYNKLHYTSRGDYCVCVRPAQLPVLTGVRGAPSLLEQYPRYFPHRNRAGYNTNFISGGNVINGEGRWDSKRKPSDVDLLKTKRRPLYLKTGERRKRGRPRKTWMEGVRAAMETRHLEEDQWLNRKEWCLGSGRRRQLS
jgi:hypothetical protein